MQFSYEWELVTMALKAIFFDLDDTLWDFKGSSETSLDSVFRRYLAQHGVEKNVWLHFYEEANDALWASYQAGTHTASEVKELRFGSSFSRVGLLLTEGAIREVSTYYLSEIVRNTRLYPGVKSTLPILGRHYQLCIISNGLAVSHARLNALGIGQHFLHIVTAADAGAPKPSAEIFAYALAVAGVSPEQAAYVGDDYHSDVLGCKRAGMLSVWYNPSEKTMPGGIAPDHMVSSFADLTDVFVNPPGESEA